MTIDLAGNGAALAAFLVVAALAARAMRGWAGAPAYLFAALATAAWAGVGVAVELGVDSAEAFAPYAEILRNAGWIWALLVLLTMTETGAPRLFAPEHPLFRVGAAIVTLNLALAALEGGQGAFGPFGRLALAVFGLLVIENAFRAMADRRGWAAKHMLIGLSVLFVFDFFMYSEALLLKQVIEQTAAARPFVTALAAPLIAISAMRLAHGDFEVGVSRRVVMTSAVLMASGVYLMAVAAAGFLLRELGLNWGPVLQIVFMIAAALCLVTALASAELRSRLRQFVTRNFFRLSYDYRAEWVRFSETMAGVNIAGVDGDLGGASHLDLHRRAIKATADLLDCSAGALYLRTRTDELELAAVWHWSDAEAHPAPPQHLVDRHRDGEDVIDFADAAPSETQGYLSRARLSLALRVRGRFIGVLIIADQRAARPLTWEDRDLLKIFSLEIGSYLGEEQVARALAEAQRFERMGKNFSFVAHDLKNIVSQLSLIVQQARRHGDNPAFQKDAMTTVDEAVGKMEALLTRLSAVKKGAAEGVEVVDAAAILKDAARRKGAETGQVTVGAAPDRAFVKADPMSLASILEHLLQNALDAVAGAPEPRILVSARKVEERWEILIEDNGPGMTRSFIDDHLFQPFASTKETGFGLGMYQCREWLEAWGGRLQIESAPGEGAKVSVVLPAVEAAVSAA